MPAQKRSAAPEALSCDVRVIHLDRVGHARSHEIPREEIERLSLLLKAIADPTRLRIVLALRDLELCVCDIAAVLGMSESAVSHQLRRLRERGLVRARREGQIVYYALDDDHVAELLELGLTHIRE